MPRLWIWLQLCIGWLPVWALYATLIVAAHPPLRPVDAAFIAFRAVVPAALLGLVVHRFTRRYRWPRPFRLSFLAVHTVAAALYSISWFAVSTGSEMALHGSAGVSGDRMVVPFLVLGIWMYVMVAGVSYAAQATDRAVVAEAAAARAQLATLRAQLHPHFLFNALHTVVQLIPRQPARAAEAAELVAGLLRSTLEEDRDLVTVAEEVALVTRYLEIERIRFGDRLIVHVDVAEPARDALVPSFALQTLVENAVQHAAAPRIEPTEIRIQATLVDGTLAISVQDDGEGATDATGSGMKGTGLQRLQERLGALYGDRARFRHGNAKGGGFKATIEIEGVAAEATAG